MQKDEIPSVVADAVQRSDECAADGGSTEENARLAVASDVLSDVESVSAGFAPGPVSQRIVYVVEHRQHISAFAGESALFSYRADLAFIASTLEIAVDWCRKNADYAPHSMDKTWDFAIRKREMDSDLVGGGLVMVLDWDGEMTGWTV